MRSSQKNTQINSITYYTYKETSERSCCFFHSLLYVIHIRFYSFFLLVLSNLPFTYFIHRRTRTIEIESWKIPVPKYREKPSSTLASYQVARPNVENHSITDKKGPKSLALHFSLVHSTSKTYLSLSYYLIILLRMQLIRRSSLVLCQKSLTNSASKKLQPTCKTMSSDLLLKEAHLETHWNGRLLKLNYATLRKKLKLEPASDWGFENVKISMENPIPSFVIRRRDMIEIEWEDGMIGILKLS